MTDGMTLRQRAMMNSLLGNLSNDFDMEPLRILKLMVWNDLFLSVKKLLIYYL